MDGQLAESSKLKFYQLRKYQIEGFQDDKITSSAVNLITVANKHRYIVVACNVDQTLRAVNIDSLFQYDWSKNVINEVAKLDKFDFVCKLNFPISLISISNHGYGSILFCSGQSGQYNSPIIQLYNLDAQPPTQYFAEISMPEMTNVCIVDVAWHPVYYDSIVALCTNDGRLMVLAIDEARQKSNFVYNNSQYGALSCCWSPKGKHLVVGRRDGRIFRLEYEVLKATREFKLKEVDKSIHSFTQYKKLKPDHQVVKVRWISKGILLVVHARPVPDQRETIYSIVSVRAGKPFYCWQDIITESPNSNDYNVHIVNLTNIIVCGTSQSPEGTFFGRHDNSQESNQDPSEWRALTVDDSARIDLPFGPNETYFRGSSLAYGIARQFYISESEFFGGAECPVIFFLTSGGTICTYHAAHKDNILVHPELQERQTCPLDFPSFSSQSLPQAVSQENSSFSLSHQFGKPTFQAPTGGISLGGLGTGLGPPALATQATQHTFGKPAFQANSLAAAPSTAQHQFGKPSFQTSPLQATLQATTQQFGNPSFQTPAGSQTGGGGFAAFSGGENQFGKLSFQASSIMSGTPAVQQPQFGTKPLFQTSPLSLTTTSTASSSTSTFSFSTQTSTSKPSATTTTTASTSIFGTPPTSSLFQLPSSSPTQAVGATGTTASSVSKSSTFSFTAAAGALSSPTSTFTVPSATTSVPTPTTQMAQTATSPITTQQNTVTEPSIFATPTTPAAASLTPTSQASQATSSTFQLPGATVKSTLPGQNLTQNQTQSQTKFSIVQGQLSSSEPPSQTNLSGSICQGQSSILQSQLRHSQGRLSSNPPIGQGLDLSGSSNSSGSSGQAMAQDKASLANAASSHDHDKGRNQTSNQAQASSQSQSKSLNYGLSITPLGLGKSESQGKSSASIPIQNQSVFQDQSLHMITNQQQFQIQKSQSVSSKVETKNREISESSLSEIVSEFDGVIKSLVQRCKDLNIDNEFKQDVTSVRSQTEELVDIFKTHQDLLKVIEDDIENLSTGLLDGFCLLENIRSRLKQSNDTKMIRRRPLDPLVTRHVTAIREKTKSIARTLLDIEIKIELEWEEIKRRRKAHDARRSKEREIAPLEIIYRTLEINSRAINTLKQAVIKYCPPSGNSRSSASSAPVNTSFQAHQKAMSKAIITHNPYFNRNIDAIKMFLESRGTIKRLPVS